MRVAMEVFDASPILSNILPELTFYIGQRGSTLNFIRFQT